MTTTAEELADALVVSSQTLMAMAIRTVAEAPVPVTVVQYRVLLLVEEAGMLSVNDIAARLSVDQSNASRHCTRLAGLGLLRRTQASHDRRAAELRLTESGRQQVQGVREARRRWAERVLTRLTEDDARTAVRGLEVFAAAARAVENT
jgi:DNA-binding MarR family transcriptional regulator